MYIKLISYEYFSFVSLNNWSYPARKCTQYTRIGSKEHDLAAPERRSLSFARSFHLPCACATGTERPIESWQYESERECPKRSRQGPPLAAAIAAHAHLHELAACNDMTPTRLCCAHSSTLCRAPCVPFPFPWSTLCHCSSLSACVCCVCVSIFCALSFARQETHIETQAETSFPLWRDIALHLHTEGNRSGSLTRSSNHHHYHQQPPPPPVLSANASARHLPAGVPLASHREKVYFMNSHKYWDWVLEIRPGRPLAAVWHRDLGVHWQNSPASTLARAGWVPLAEGRLIVCMKSRS